MLNIKTTYVDKEVRIQIDDGLSLWYSPNSGDLKSYIASNIFSAIFLDETKKLNVKYFYINYANRVFFDSSIKSKITSNSLVVIDNAELIVENNSDLIKEMSLMCPVVLIGGQFDK